MGPGAHGHGHPGAPGWHGDPAWQGDPGWHGHHGWPGGPGFDGIPGWWDWWPLLPTLALAALVMTGIVLLSQRGAAHSRSYWSRPTKESRGKSLELVKE